MKQEKATCVKTKWQSLCAALLLLITSPALAQTTQTLAAWNPVGLANAGPSPWSAASTSTDMSVGDLTRGAGVSTTAAQASAWGGVNWSAPASASTTVNNMDATFTMAVNPGSIVSYSMLTLSYKRSNTGPAAGTFEYAFGAASNSYSVAGILNFSAAVTGASAMTPIDLSVIPALQNVPAGTVVKFRIFPQGGNSIGNWWIFGSAGMKVIGTISGFGVTITQTAPIGCNGQATAALTASAVGSTPPYTYNWQPAGGTSSVAVNLGAGVYSCLVTSANSETTMSTYTIVAPATLSASVVAQNSVSCFGGANGSATISASGGTPAYTYSWMPSGGTASVATGLTAGNYTLSLKDVNNCATMQTVSIAQPTNPVMASSSNTGVCQGSTVSVNATGSSSSYTWTGGVSNNVAFTPTATAIYTVTGTYASNCNGSATIAVAVNPNPTLNVVSSKSVMCKGETATLTVQGADNYTWIGVASTSSTSIISPTVNTSYIVTGTTLYGCSRTATYTQIVNTCTGIENIANTGGQQLLIMPNPSNGEFILRSTSAIQLQLSNELGQFIQTIQLNAGNNYELQVKNLAQGIYFITGANAGMVVKQKVVVTN